MKRLLIAVLVVVFAVSFTVGILVSTAQAKPPCFATCLNGTYWVCCPLPGGGLNCFWGDPCDWPGWIP